MIKILVASVAAAASVAGAGWGAHAYLERYAEKDEVMVASAKADFVLDRQMSAILREIGYLERKQHKTSSELERLRYLREQLREMQRVRRGK